ncbi:MAG: AfsR/SARP family transcriptional regulator, partial [Acidimicrobiales bacterium]
AEATWAADEPGVDWLERALRHLAASVAPAPGTPCPRPVVVQAGDRWIDVLLREPSTRTPAPWRPQASGRIWRWDRDAGFELPEPDPDRWAPLPGLVSLGAHDDDGSLLLFDIEAEGVVGLTGPADTVGGLARSMVLELTCTPLREAATVLTMVGFDVPGVDALQHIRRCGSFDDISGELLDVARTRRHALDRLNFPTTFAARAAGNLGLGAPDIAVLGSPPDDTSFAELCHLLGDRRGGMAVICVGWCPPGAFPIEVADNTVRLPTLGLAARAQAVAEDTAARLGELVDSPDGPAEPAEPAEEPADIVAEQQPLPLDLPEPAVPGLVIDSYDDRPYRVLVRLLAGPPTVLNGPHIPPKHTAALAYVALHRSVTLDRLRDAVWGGKPVSPKTVRNVLNKLRELLPGAVSDVFDGRVTAGPDLATDVELFERRVAYARRQPPTEASTTLKAALELVKDQPFAYLGRNDASYRWVDHENWGSRWEAKVVDAADRLGTLHLDAGAYHAACRAAERGLAISPANRQLTRQLIQAYRLLGQPEVASRVADEYQRVTEELGVDDEDGESLLDMAAASDGRRPNATAGDIG